MWIASLVLCCYLPWSVMVARADEGLGYGMTKDNDGNVKYTTALQCEYSISQLLIPASYIEDDIAERKTYVSAAIDCCYAKATRNQCCQYVDKTGDTPVNKCKCAPEAQCSACPAGMTSFEEKGLCVELVTTAKDRAGASAECLTKKGSLAKISSRSYQEFLETTILKKHTTKVWIGVERKTPGYRLTQTPSADLTYDNWKTPQTGGDCVVLSQADSWKWDKLDCKTEANYICQMPSTGTCTSPWASAFAGYCVQVFATSVGFGAANSQCQDNGAYLLQITSSSDQSEIEAILSKITENVWIGVRKLADPDFTLAGDTNAIPFYNWIPSRPTSIVENDCVTLDSSKSWGWTDEKCDGSNSFICEQPALP